MLNYTHFSQGKENGQYLIDQVCAHLDLAEKEYFGLIFEDGNKYKVSY